LLLSALRAGHIDRQLLALHTSCTAAGMLSNHGAAARRSAANAGSVMWTMLNTPHTHLFNGPLSGTTRVSRYQKGKTNLDFTEARDSEWQWHKLGICKSAPCYRQITMPAPHPSVFYRPDALPATKPTASNH